MFQIAKAASAAQTAQAVLIALALTSMAFGQAPSVVDPAPDPAAPGLGSPYLGQASGDYQNAPGYLPPIPGPGGLGRLYVPRPYTKEDYLRPAVGPRPYANYAPSGLYPSDYQEAPGLPLYRPILPDSSTPPGVADRLVERGLFPGSYLVPGSNTSFRFSGFVRLGATYSLKPIGTPDQFVTNTIPVPQTSGQDVNFSARPTRLSLDTWTPTPFHDWNVHTFIQFDFFSGAAPGVGSSSVPRLRFAFADFGYFRVGQDTSVFMDPQSFPRTADFAGPRGLVNSRQGLARVTVPLADQLFWASAVEQPFSDITTLGMGNNVQDVPDFTSHLRYEADLGHLQASTIVRSIGYQPTGGSTTRDLGWGMNLTGNVFPWALLMGRNPVREENPTGLERSRILVQYAFGWGINRYIQDPSGLGLDGAVTANGGFERLYGVGWTASYEHWFNDHWLSNITYSSTYTGHTDAQPGTTYAGAKYLACSVWWVPVVNMSLGVEYLLGDRKNLNGQTADADRIQTVFQYNF